jgi:hypothetical protein
VEGFESQGTKLLEHGIALSPVSPNTLHCQGTEPTKIDPGIGQQRTASRAREPNCWNNELLCCQCPPKPSTVRGTNRRRLSQCSAHEGKCVKHEIVDEVTGVQLSTRMNKVDPEGLSAIGGIVIESARRTLKVTTQRGVRTVLRPSLSRRFRTNDRLW